MRRIFFSILLMLPVLLFSYSFSDKQIENLKQCIAISKLFNNNPELVCTIMLNETSAGENLKYGVGDRFLRPFDRSYGVMQVRFRTCKFLINKLNIKFLKKLPDEKILVFLMEDNKFNIAIANMYISYLKKKYKGDEKKIVIAYNSGYYNHKNKKYWKRFLKNKRIFQEFLRKYDAF